MSLEDLNKRRTQQQAMQDKQICVHESTNIMMKLDKLSIDNAMNILCACAASTIRNRLHPTNYMEAVGQFGMRVHGMLFSQAEILKEQQEIREAVLSDLAEIEQWANRGKYIADHYDTIDILPASKAQIELYRMKSGYTTLEEFISWLDEQLILQARQGIKKENTTQDFPQTSLILTDEKEEQKS